jgi:hypothetical protein
VDVTPPAAASPFEAPTQPQSPYQTPSYPPPVAAYGIPPPTPYQQPATYTPPDVTPPYSPLPYEQGGFQNQAFYAEAQRWQRQARTAVILGILGFICCGLLGPVALALGIQSRNGLQRLGVVEGQTMALIGIIFGGLTIVAWLLSILVLLIPG